MQRGQLTSWLGPGVECGRISLRLNTYRCYALVTQMVECLSYKEDAGGSSPSGRTKSGSLVDELSERPRTSDTSYEGSGS